MKDVMDDRKPGWKLVPSDVTHAQMAAGIAMVNQLNEEMGDKLASAEIAEQVYLAMIDAADDTDPHGLREVARSI